MKWFVIGRVLKPHGVRGELKIAPETDFPQRFRQEKSLTFEMRGTRDTYDVEGIKDLNRGLFVIKLKGVDSVEDAEKMRGASIVVDESRLFPLDEGEYYHHQLIGCEVVDIKLGVLGTLKEIFFNGGTDVYVVDGEKEIMIPAIKEMVKEIDVENRRISVEVYEGLI